MNICAYLVVINNKMTCNLAASSSHAWQSVGEGRVTFLNSNALLGIMFVHCRIKSY